VLVGSSLTHCPAWGRTRTLLIQNLGWANHNQSNCWFSQRNGRRCGSFLLSCRPLRDRTRPQTHPGEGENLSGEFHIRGDSYFFHQNRTLSNDCSTYSPCSTLVKRPATDRDKALAKRSMTSSERLVSPRSIFSHICPVNLDYVSEAFLRIASFFS